MSLTIFLGTLTLAPAVLALVIFGLGRAGRAMTALVLGLAALGVLVPIVSLLFLAPDLSFGDPLQVTLFGAASGSTVWFSPAYRLDAFGLYAAFGLAIIVIPLLLWMAWRATSTTEITEIADADLPSDPDAERVDDPEDISPRTAVSPDMDTEGQSSDYWRRLVPATTWASVALVLGVETAALTLVFSDNILWLGLSWLVLAALVWGLGEVSSDPETLDWPGLVLMLVGPLLWTAAMLLVAVPAQAARLIDLMGRGSVVPLPVIVLAIILALAGGAYPFTVWVRRRVSLAVPAGLAAVVLVALPAAIFVGARTYSAIESAQNLWPQIGAAQPPITAGIAFVLLGAVTVAVSGLLALERRDARSLIAFLAVAQVGWGLLALGAGQPVSLLGLVVLLAASVLGLGAMLASLHSGGMLNNDIEPDGAGPRPFGAPIRPLSLAAWSIGATALVGVPLGAAFVARQMVSAAVVNGGGLSVPLVALAWAGDALLALAILRVTAPAFTAAMGSAAAADAMAAASDSTAGTAAVAADVVADTDTDADADVDADSDAVAEPTSGRAATLISRVTSLVSRIDPHELPGAALALLALLVAIAPQWLLASGGNLAAGTLLQAGTLDSAVKLTPTGYSAGPGQWLPGIAWLAIIVMVVILAFLRPRGPRATQPTDLAGQTAVAEEDEPAELVGLPEPEETWKDLDPAFRSAWTMPAAEWLLVGTEDEDEEEAAEAGESERIPSEVTVDATPPAADKENGDATLVTPDTKNTGKRKSSGDTGRKA